MKPNSCRRVLRVVLGAVLVAAFAFTQKEAIAQTAGKQSPTNHAEPPGNAQQSPADATHPSDDAQQPRSDASDPPGDSRDPRGDVQPPPNDAAGRSAFQSRAVPIRRLPPVASKGGCEPRYRNGMVGTCINDKPCRGFGVREDDGSAQCVCYIRRSGCNEDERCSAEEGQCVPDDEGEFNREH